MFFSGLCRGKSRQTSRQREREEEKIARDKLSIVLQGERESEQE